VYQSLVIVLLATLALTLVGPAVSGISSIQQAKAATSVQNGKMGLIFFNAAQHDNVCCMVYILTYLRIESNVMGLPARLVKFTPMGSAIAAFFFKLSTY